MLARRNCMNLLAASLTAFGLLGGCADSGGDARTVNAELREFAIDLDKSSAPAGKVTFRIENTGEEVHEFVVLKTDLAPGQLPLDDKGNADEEANGVVAMGEVEDIEPGMSDELTLDLERGNYVIICNITTLEDGMAQHHYPLGMYTGFTVK